MSQNINFRTDAAFAAKMDEADPLRDYRKEFHFPIKDKKPVIYLNGNSLGLASKRAVREVQNELFDWASFGEAGHFPSTAGKKNPWLPYHENMTGPLARLVGAEKSEVVVMGTLTSNLHLLMSGFYTPDQKRNKIVIEGSAFPSDQYAAESHIDNLGAKFRKVAGTDFGVNSQDALVRLQPRMGERVLRTEDIVGYIGEHSEEIALVLMGGVNYLTGEVMDMAAITEAAHQAGAKAGFDLAHATGNIPLELHKMQADFATGCNYKYMSGGPGAIAYIFVHEKHHGSPDIPRLGGWWGHNKATRFVMPDEFDPMPGAEGWQQSNIPIFSAAAVLASLEMFDEVGIEALRKKSLLMTDYLYFLLDSTGSDAFEVITPREHERRGAQFSISVRENGRAVYDALRKAGIECNWREPDCIRVTPAPFYNSFGDIHSFATVFTETLGLKLGRSAAPGTGPSASDHHPAPGEL